jgi:hypothetical protein
MMFSMMMMMMMRAYREEVSSFNVLNTEVNRDREPIAVAYI